MGLTFETGQTYEKTVDMAIDYTEQDWGKGSLIYSETLWLPFTSLSYKEMIKVCYIYITIGRKIFRRV